MKNAPMMRKLAVVLGAALVLTACGGSGSGGESSSETTATGGSETSSDTGTSGSEAPPATTDATLTTAIGFDIDSLDPAAQVTTNVMQLLKMGVETFTKMEPDGAISPSLAEEWTTAEDGLSWDFKLREGVTFQDGEPFNAEAAKFNFDRVISPDTFKAAPNVLTVIESTEVVDEYTLRLNLKNAFAPLAAALSFPVSGMISPKSATVAPNTVEQIQNPVGTGPYILTSWTAGQEVVMDRFDGYWGTAPAYAKQIFKIVPEASSREALLRSGGADVIAAPPASSLPTMDADPSLSVVWADTSYVVQMVFNTKSESQPLIQDQKVRQALNYAIDRQALIDNVLFSSGKMLDGMIPANVFGACAMESPYNYDPEKAKAMLAEAGATDMTLNVVSPNGRYVQDYKVAEAVVGQLNAVGVKASLGPATDWPTYLSTLYVPLADAQNELSLLGWGTLYGDASQSLLQLRNDYIPPDGLNATYWDSQEYTDLVDEGNAATSQDARLEPYCAAQKLAYEAAPVIWLYQMVSPIVTTSEVANVNGLPNLMFETTWATPAG